MTISILISISIFFKSVDISTIDMSYRYIEQGYPSSICRKLGIGVKKGSEGIEDRFEKEIIQAVKVTLISSVQSSLTLLKFGDFPKSPDG